MTTDREQLAKKFRVWAFLCGALVAVSCRPEVFIGDALSDGVDSDSTVPSETDSDSGSDSASPSDGESDSVIEHDTDTETDSELETDSEPEPPDCDAATAVPGDANRSLTVAGQDRTYVLHIPDSYTGDVPVPLIIDYHAVASSGPEERGASPYVAATAAEGVVMAFPTGLPTGLGNAWNIGPCCVDNADDLAFTRAIVDDIKATACIDPTQMYAVGTSMGGGMANALACNAADLFAAIAPSAFDLDEVSAANCSPSRPISVISFRGTDDPLVPYGGGYSNLFEGNPLTFIGAVATFDTWAIDINGCSGTPANDEYGCQRYGASQCPNGVEVVLCTDQGGSIAHGDAAIAWPFLKQHPLM